MLRDDTVLNEKIHRFLRRKEAQYPRLTFKPASRRRQDDSHDVNAHPYILIDS